MPESPLPEFTDDQPLEANLARLLNRDGDRPALSAAAESHILESLRAKQAELVARKEPSMDRSVTAAAPQRANWAFAAVALVVVACLFMVTLFFPAIAPNGGGGSPSESGGDGDDSGEVAENTVKKDVDATQLTRTKLADGTVVIARPGAKYTLDAPRQITLHGGDLYLIVAKSKTPFVVNTNNGTVTATGTRFVVSAGDETTAAVAQGHVTLAGKQGQTELQVGEQGVLRDDGPPQRTPAPRLSHLVSWAKEALAQEDLLVEKTAAENGLIAVDPWGQESRLTLRQYNVDVYIEDGIARTR